MVLIAATDQQTTEEAYYRSVQELGQCHKEKLSNRTGAMFLEMGINLQDIRIKIGMETNLRIIRNERQYLTYIPDKIWNVYVKNIAMYNKEVRISGQNSNIQVDPRKLLNRRNGKTR